MARDKFREQSTTTQAPAGEPISGVDTMENTQAPDGEQLGGEQQLPEQEQTSEQQLSEQEQTGDEQPVDTQEQSTEDQASMGEGNGDELPLTDENSSFDGSNEGSTPETKEEVVLTEEELKAQAQEQAEPTIPSYMLTLEDVKNILADPDMFEEEKLEHIGKYAVPSIAMLSEFLNTFKNTLDPKAVQQEAKTIVGKHFDLFNQISRVVSEENYEIFKVKFDIINMYFRVFATGAFNDVALHRFGNLWKWGETKLRAFENFVIAISSLNNIETRKVALKKLDLNKVLDKEATGLSETAIANIKKYYAM